MNPKSVSLAVFVLIAITGLFIYFTKASPITPPPAVTPTVTPRTPADTITPMDKLEITDVRTGTGSAVKSGDTIVVHYTGTLADGKKFDSSLDRGQPFTTQIGVGRVIPGWDQGLIGMKVGGLRRLQIPSVLGYGSRGAGSSIPPDSDLIFEIQLLEIRP